MTRADIHGLISLMGFGRSVDRNEWVMCSCPFAVGKHDGGEDNNPSFGVSVHDSSQSRYHCFSCHSKGLLMTLPTALIMDAGWKDVPKARAFLSENEVVTLEPYEDEDYLVEMAPQIAEVVLDRFDPVKPGILKRRSISPSQAKKHELLFDSYEQRLVFPVRDSDGRLVGFRGRYMGSDIGPPKYRGYTELSKSGRDPKSFGVWYGCHFTLKQGKAITLVEGEIDRIALDKTKKFSNVWAAMGSQITRAQISVLQELALPVVCFFDDDRAGHDAQVKVLSKMSGLADVFAVKRYHGCDDPAEVVENGYTSKVIKSIRRIS